MIKSSDAPVILQLNKHIMGYKQKLAALVNKHTDWYSFKSDRIILPFT